MDPIINDGTSARSLEELRGQGIINDLVQKFSNIGSGNIFKGPTARTLFYEAGKRRPGKYGQFLFYSLGNHENNFIDAYYRSENREYNRAVSSRKSKNPSAGHLVRETFALEVIAANCDSILNGFTSSFEKSIIGGMAAPYYWKDFLFCKYYATIPNNYMVTLRRFPTPVLDNLSVPGSLKSSGTYNVEGLGRPVAQAVTWFGGNTGNKINDMLSFSTGIQWEEKSQSEVVEQQAFSRGFLDDVGKLFSSALGVGDPTIIENAKAIANAAAISSDPNNTSLENTKFMKLRERMKDPSTGGLLSEYIWTSVDVVNKTHVRKMGLPFSWGNAGTISITFEYDLTSVGEVNTKASMLDIIGNLLSIGTNYGSFLTPDFRYNSNFPAYGFPGGDKGLEMFYKDPLQFIIDYADQLVNPVDSAKNAAADANRGSFDDTEMKKSMETILKESKGNFGAGVKQIKELFGSSANRLLKTVLTPSFFEAYQLPASLLTGAPIGEWHLVIGNPCNPIAMIGNLICDGVKIDFGEALGPDDFPTFVKAVFTLKHGRDRERGEIESIFNRGDGRLYQSSMPTTANAQSYDAISTVDGKTLKNAVTSVFSQEAYGTSANNQASPGA
jgi:hypothetical protein